MFLSVETNCFDERNGFQQFSESLEWFGAVFELKKNSCGNCFDERNGSIIRKYRVVWGSL